MRRLFSWIALPSRFHFWGSIAGVLLVSWTISQQVGDRRGFANAELHRDVMERWGAPISQPSPSVRYVPSGTTFNSLQRLPLAKQSVNIQADMNYRKRGLVYFSGFDFTFDSEYEVVNTQRRDIDIVFVFPINLEKNKVLLSGLRFEVNGKEKKAALGPEGDKLTWTGRLSANQKARFRVFFKGRGLEQFVYRADPSSSVRNLAFNVTIRGGDNYDYPSGVVPASVVSQQDGKLKLRWNYPSLESGVPLGVILPSEKSFDTIIVTMVRRCLVPFLPFFVGITLLFLSLGRRLRFYEMYLISASYGFFFVLLPYFAAFMNFYLAYAISALLITLLLFFYTRALLSTRAAQYALGLLATCLFIPTIAVVAQGFTGLIYTLEILVGLATIMALTARDGLSGLIGQLAPQTEEGASHAV